MTTNIIGVRSKNNNVFYFSSYWRTWSRILNEGTPHNGGKTVEVDLTAINGYHGAAHWEKTKSINIRSHTTSRSSGDLFVGTLPQEAIDLMRTYMEEEIIQRLLHEDFLPHIDWRKYMKRCNGGAPFDEIKFDAAVEKKPDIKVCPVTPEEITAWVQQFQPHFNTEECLQAWKIYRSYRDEGQTMDVSRQYAGL